MQQTQKCTLRHLVNQMESTSLAYFLSQLRLLLMVSTPIRSLEDSTPIALNLTPELRNSGSKWSLCFYVRPMLWRCGVVICQIALD